MLLAGRYAITNSPFLQGWQQEYMKAHGSMPSLDKTKDFLISVIRNESIPIQNKQAEINLLNQFSMQG